VMWKEKYKIGIPAIDEQHEELFRRVSDFVVSLRQEGDWQDKLEKVKETMEFMKNYVVTHFNYEEAYQKQIQYPEYEEHCKIHKMFTEEINQYAERFEREGYTEELVQKLGGKLMAWLINHVAATDQQMANYVAKREADKV
jgi:hemerythrin